MKIRTTLRNIGVLCSFGAGVLWRRAFRRPVRQPSVTRIVCFHKAGHLPVLTDKIALLCRHYNIVSLDEVVAGRISSIEVNVAVTFDDGYAGWLQVMEVLEHFHVPVTFFICSAYLDCRTEEAWRAFCRSRLQLKLPEPGLSWAQARSLARHPLVQIGGHTHSHAALGTLNDPVAIAREVDLNKRQLEARLGCRVDYFAYPFGDLASISAEARRAVIKAGYRLAVTLVPGANTERQDPFLLHRDCLDEVDSALMIRARLGGGCDWWWAREIQRRSDMSWLRR